MHDFLFAKRGIALGKAHPLREAVERHGTRLKAELSRERVRRGCGGVEELRVVVEGEYYAALSAASALDGVVVNEDGAEGSGSGSGRFPHPRWLRVNTLRSTLEVQLATTFAGYERVEALVEVLAASHEFYGPKSRMQEERRIYYVDEHVPGLIALPAGVQIAKMPAYMKGEVVAQDKASCFPGILIDPGSLFSGGGKDTEEGSGDVLDACAAPGNKSTHLAAVLAEGIVGNGEVGGKVGGIEEDGEEGGMRRASESIWRGGFFKLEC